MIYRKERLYKKCTFPGPIPWIWEARRTSLSVPRYNSIEQGNSPRQMGCADWSDLMPDGQVAPQYAHTLPPPSPCTHTERKWEREREREKGVSTSWVTHSFQSRHLPQCNNISQVAKTEWRGLLLCSSARITTDRETDRLPIIIIR